MCMPNIFMFFLEARCELTLDHRGSGAVKGQTCGSRLPGRGVDTNIFHQSADSNVHVF
jgi:hypothetical protein